MQGDDDVIAGCPDEATELVPAAGTRAHSGARFLIALCAQHAEASSSGVAITITLGGSNGDTDPGTDGGTDDPGREAGG
jgi:hypothetical protein